MNTNPFSTNLRLTSPLVLALNRMVKNATFSRKVGAASTIPSAVKLLDEAFRSGTCLVFHPSELVVARNDLLALIRAGQITEEEAKSLIEALPAE